RVRLEDVDARVDRVAGDFVFAWLFEKAPDIAVRVGLDEPVRARVVNRRQDDGRLGAALPMQPEYGAEVNLGQHITVEDHDRIGQRVARIADRAPGAERHGLDHIAKTDTQAGALPENLFHSPA